MRALSALRISPFRQCGFGLHARAPGMKLKAPIVVLTSLAHPFANNERLGSGLALVDPEQGMLLHSMPRREPLLQRQGTNAPYAKLSRRWSRRWSAAQ